jgi:hypothetical protein
MAMISASDRNVLRQLAGKWMEWAAAPVMEERKRLWRAVHDLRAERPVILVETAWIEGYVEDREVLCEDPFLRSVERSMRVKLRQAEELNDDIVIEPHYQLGWRMQFSDHGVPVEIHSAVCPQKSMAYSFSFPIAAPTDVDTLKPRTFAVDRAESLRRRDLLNEAVGDLLPVQLGNYDPFVYEFDVGPYGDLGFTGNYFFGLTWQVYRFIGNQGLLYWVYDAPEAIHRLMAYMLDDRQALFDFFQREGLLAANTDSQMAGPCMYGYVSDLPAPRAEAEVTLKHLWGWAESQEAANISPAMYGEFVLPYLAKLSERFGLIYYGCCERVDDRLPLILDAIPNLRSVSVSGWSNLARTAELLGKNYVYSRKPVPAHISGACPHWELLEKDLRDTCAAARDCNLEILFRDIYTINGERARLRRWVDMAKSIFKI